MNPQSNKVIRMLGAWLAASAPHHTVEAFISMRLIPVEGDSRFFLMLHSEKARRVRGLGEIEQAGEMFPPSAHGRFRLPIGI
jgi:hypothetical protein